MLGVAAIFLATTATKPIETAANGAMDASPLNSLFHAKVGGAMMSNSDDITRPSTPISAPAFLEKLTAIDGSCALTGLDHPTFGYMSPSSAPDLFSCC